MTIINVGKYEIHDWSLRSPELNDYQHWCRRVNICCSYRKIETTLVTVEQSKSSSGRFTVYFEYSSALGRYILYDEFISILGSRDYSSIQEAKDDFDLFLSKFIKLKMFL